MRFCLFKKGQSLFEAIIAIAIFAISASALIVAVLGGGSGVVSASLEAQGVAFADEGVEAVRSIHDGAWNELQYAQSQVAVSGGQWVLNGNASPEISGGFTRTIMFASVCRDGSNTIAPCPATYTDAHTKQVTSTVSWEARPGATNSVQRVAYLSNWDSKDWIQTDWSGGSGQAIWSNIARYDTGSNINNSITGGVQLSTSLPAWATHASSGLTAQTINEVSTVSATDAWAVGNSSKFFRYNGSTWSEVIDLGSNNIFGIDMISATDGWAVGATGKFWRWDGSAWSEFNDTGSQTWNAVHMLSATDGWAVGSGGAIRRWDGSAWNNISSPVPQALNDVFMLSATDGWAVGNSGKILRWNGSVWSEAFDIGNQTWNAVYMVSAIDGWAVGSGGAIRRWNGSVWNNISSPVVQALSDVFMVSANDGWAVGLTGVIIKWNGSAWSVISSPISQTLNSIAMTDSNNGWSVGDAGTIIQYGPQYSSPGVLTSSAFNLTDSSPVQVIEWDESIPSGCSPACSIQLQIQTAPDGDATPATCNSSPGAWSALSSIFTISKGERIPINFNGNCWVRYQATLNGDTTHTPILNEVRINYK
ncbi:MAG: hypothetical protein AAB482_01850 [Patescibacteria group bacterium]